ncbi:Nitrate ABC transporter, ATP-binding protein [Candidatus Methylacidithermus pantelleriae]|uniref:Nitrate ABC transporter, ATP-binding protein n=2 Tax=Candidatus Methylacidithermus pantelleriae TaxID=2744239 RepID=A0A8J2FSJ0_9BACT|nr:Nitrate ABC transporter, ATP-binding protein [Candidatus Methylacidithermus pantelleriae]
MIEVCGVWKSYWVRGSVVPVLRGLDWRVEAGQWVSLVGRSGSGKSTLVGILAGLIEPDRGSVRIGNPNGGGGKVCPAIVFQNYSLLPWLSAYENVLLAVEECSQRLPGIDPDQEAKRLLDLVGLSKAAWKRPGDLSGGMRQRVALARALAFRSPVLLLDEPLSALDAFTRARLQEELAAIASSQGQTIVLVTNDLEEALRLGDRVWALAGGRLWPPEGVRLGGTRPRTKQELWASPSLRKAKALLEKLLRGGPSGEKFWEDGRMIQPELVGL